MSARSVSTRGRHLDVDSSSRRDTRRGDENRLEGDHIEVGQTKPKRSVSRTATSCVDIEGVLYHDDPSIPCL